MHPNPKIVIPVFLFIILALIAVAFYFLKTSQENGTSIFSGTIEATEVHLASELGGSVTKVYVKEGELIQEGQALVEVRPTVGARERINSPIDGVVLERLVEPGETTTPGATLMVVSNLNELTLTVFVPEDRYGHILLGQTYPVMVDSFPDQTFKGTVSHIADKAEFTPRNVQTVNNRKTTVFAIKLSLEASDGKLKPGMPADVQFQVNQ